MQQEERLRLRKIYENMSDEILIERLLEDKESYREGVYELIWEEATKRGIDIEKIIDEMKESERQIKEDRNKNWVEVYKFHDNLVGHTLEAIFKEHNIPCAVISLDDSAYDGLLNKSPYGQGVIEVREDYTEEARKIVADFEMERQKKNE